MTSNSFILNVYELDLTPVGERLVSLPIRIGRSSLNDVCVAHRLVSEFHARIEEVGDRICVRDLNSKNGVLVEAVGSASASRIAAQTPIDLEPYGFEFLLSPLLRVRVRPANGLGEARLRHSHALGSVLGNGTLATTGAPLAENPATEGFAPGARGAVAPDVVRPAPAGAPRLTPLVSAPVRANASPSPPGPVPGAHSSRTALSPGHAPSPAIAPPPTLPPRASAEARNPHTAVAEPRLGSGTRAGHAPPYSASPAVQPYASVLIEPASGSLALPPLPGTLAVAPPLAARDAPAPDTRPSRPSPGRNATLLEPHAPEPVVPPLAHTAWELGHGTLPAAAAQPMPPPEAPGRSIEALALRGLRELAASLLPGQPVETAADVVRLVTKLHDAVEMFCRCFIPVREACSRFMATDELERAAAERCQNRSYSYLAIERALEPRAVAAALLDWHNDDQDAPRAVEHILADLMLHHLALAQSAIEGTKALLDELSPARIESQQPPNPSMLTRLGLPGARERELWDTFLARHADLAAAGRSFRELFGETFTRAYAIHHPPPGSGPSL